MTGVVRRGLRVVVTGGRALDDLRLVGETLMKIHTGALGPISELAHGGARGADEHARDWAVHHPINVVEYRATWSQHGPSAGPARNARMLDDFKPDVVIAFPGGNGTADCKRKAWERGILVLSPADPEAERADRLYPRRRA